MHNKPSTQEWSKRKRIENYIRFSKKLKQKSKIKNQKKKKKVKEWQINQVGLSANQKIKNVKEWQIDHVGLSAHYFGVQGLYGLSLLLLKLKIEN